MPSRPVRGAVHRDVLGLRRDAERRQVEAGDAAKARRRDVPAHQVVREVGERMADRRQLPVEDREDARLGRMEDQVVEAVVAVDDRRRAVVRRECAPAAIRSAGPSRRCARSPRPCTACSSGRSAARSSCRACRSRRARSAAMVDVVQRRDDAVHLAVDRARARRASCRAGSGPTARGRRRSPSRRTRGRSRSRPRTARASARPARRCPAARPSRGTRARWRAPTAAASRPAPGFARIAYARDGVVSLNVGFDWPPLNCSTVSGPSKPATCAAR